LSCSLLLIGTLLGLSTELERTDTTYAPARYPEIVQFTKRKASVNAFERVAVRKTSDPGSALELRELARRKDVRRD
jgi:hypothetical protein